MEDNEMKKATIEYNYNHSVTTTDRARGLMKLWKLAEEKYS